MPGQPQAAYWLVGALTAVCFLGGLVAHELGHALLARRFGVRTRNITLWLFGGVASFENEAPSAGAEAAIAAVGPLVSIVIGAVLLGIAAVAPPSLAAYAVLWLGWINLSLAVFNLLPAFPLDGGRVLSALLWRTSGDRVRGTARAAQVGRVLSGLMMLAGLAELFFSPGLGGLWLILLGWFLFSASRAEESSVTIRHALEGVRVREVMTSPVELSPDWITVHEFLESYAKPHNFTTFPLRDFEGRLSGLVRLRRLLTVPTEQRSAVAVRELATPLAEMPQVRPDDLVIDALQKVGPGPTDGRLLVVEEGRAAGIVAPSDIARALQLRTTGLTV